MNITLPSYYGDRTLTIPDGIDCEVLRPNKVVCDPFEDIVDQAFNNPVGSEGLDILVRKKKGAQVCVICEDLTRHSPTDMILPELFNRLNQGGIPDEDIFVVMALGTHRPMTEEEIAKKVGQEIADRVKIYNSEFLDKAKLVHLGSHNGYPLWLDKRVAEADIRIGVGSIVPHPVAGWSGGAKIIIPGVTGVETVNGFHLSAHEFTENMFGKFSTPPRDLMERLVKQIGLDFVVNTVYTPENEVYAIVCGDFVLAQRDAVKRAQDVYCMRATRKAELVISNSHPADGDFWQAGKAIHSGDIVTEDGGEIVLVTYCPEGIGPHGDLPDLFERALVDREALLQDALAGKVNDIIGASSALMRSKTIMQRKRLGLVSEGLDPAMMRRLGFTVYDSLEDVIEQHLAKAGSSKRVSVVTHGGAVLPLID